MLRRIVAALLMLGPLYGPASVFAATRPHECRDHICFCRPRPMPSNGGGCHRHGGTAGDEHAPKMRGFCDHDSASAMLTLEPHVLTEPCALDREATVVRVAALTSASPAAGFRTPELRPPQSTSDIA